MAAQQILVLGGGFAGLWSAVGAARKLDELELGPDDAQVTLVNRDEFHGIRVRNYEADLSDVRVPLDDVLEPIGVQRVEGQAESIDVARQSVGISAADGRRLLAYDRLVIALGSELFRPPIPGLSEFSFDVDTYAGAARLNVHLQSLPARAGQAGAFTVAIVGAGLTGIETAAEMPGRLRAALLGAGVARPFRVLLIDSNSHVGSDMGSSAQPVIEAALSELHVETRLGVRATNVGRDSLTLSSGEVIPTSTVIWCAGMRAHPLVQQLPIAHDRWGRIRVDKFLRVEGVPHVLAAGDVAAAKMDAEHDSVMSCQHSRPMGRFAGHNVVCDLLGLPLLPLEIPWYVTVLDLGPAGALYAEGWDRQVVSQGTTAKATKQIINCERIYPPRSRNRAEIFAAAAPIVQSPPPQRFE